MAKKIVGGSAQFTQVLEDEGHLDNISVKPEDSKPPRKSDAIKKPESRNKPLTHSPFAKAFANMVLN